ncbi:MAG: helix-turn-helix domain-containing protein [Oscillospiraceae bacterium]|nr:helix-turn-helix domain-containing protein [Oscillospiraceae bacterium]
MSISKKYAPNVQCNKLPRGKEHPFTMISNDKSSFAWDNELSLAGFGLMCKIQSFGEWNFSIAGFSRLFKDGETKIASVLKELTERGYLVMERLRDKFGKYESYSYHFFESSAECLEYKKNREKESKEAKEKKHAKDETKSNTTMSKSDTPVKQVEQSDETTTTQSENIEASETEIITILKRNIVETTQEFAEKTAGYLSSAISKGIISLNDIINKLKAIINKEHSLDSFMHTLDEKCTHALKNLKHSHAKYSYIRKTVVNILREYELEPKQQLVQQSIKQADNFTISKDTDKPKEEIMPKTLSFRELLTQLNSSLLTTYANEEYWGVNFDSAEEFWSCFDIDEYEYDMKECIIPENLRYNPENMENALKFLMSWNSLESGEFKSFSEYTISCLAEVLQTGKCCNQQVNCHNLISYLNYINLGGKDEYERETNEDSIYNFMRSFFNYYCKKIEEYPPKSANKRGYLTKMLINYLSGEYQAYHAHLHACMNNINKKIKFPY